jgi:hypothetical protein
MMKEKSRRKTERMLMMGALMASATLGARPAVASQAAVGHKSRYEEAIADVLRTMRWAHGADAQQAPATQRFDIPPGVLRSVLAAFEAQTRVNVTVTRAGIYELQSPGVSGQFSP